MDMFSVLLGKYLGTELLGDMVTLRLLFEELPDCFPEWLHFFPFPPEICEDFHLSSNLRADSVEHLSMCFLPICVSSLKTYLFRSFQIGLSSYFWLLNVLYIFHLQVLYQIYYLQKFDPILCIFL